MSEQKPTARRYDVTCRNCGQTIEQVGTDTVPIRLCGWCGSTRIRVEPSCGVGRALDCLRRAM